MQGEDLDAKIANKTGGNVYFRQSCMDMVASRKLSNVKTEATAAGWGVAWTL